VGSGAAGGATRGLCQAGAPADRGIYTTRMMPPRLTPQRRSALGALALLCAAAPAGAADGSPDDPWRTLQRDLERMRAHVSRPAPARLRDDPELLAAALSLPGRLAAADGREAGGEAGETAPAPARDEAR